MAGSSARTSDLFPAYNHTFFSFSVSPLFHKPTRASTTPRTDNFLTPRALKQQAAALRSFIVSDSSLSFPTVDATTGRPAGSTSLGTLKSCCWTILPDEQGWISQLRQSRASNDRSDDDELLAPPPAISAADARGVLITVEFDAAVHTAVLIRENRPSLSTAEPPSPPSSFSAFPLLLTHMPSSLRTLLIAFLSRSFDCRIAPLKMSPSSLTTALETAISALDNPSDAEIQASTVTPIHQSLRIVQLTFAFPGLGPELKSVEVSVTKKDISGFLSHGDRLAQQQSSGGERAANSGFSVGPFTRALEVYLQTHLALTVSHPAVRLVRLSSGLFALSADGKVKLTAPSEPPASRRRSPTRSSNRQRDLDSIATASSDPGSPVSSAPRPPLLATARSSHSKALQQVLNLLIDSAAPLTD